MKKTIQVFILLFAGINIFAQTGVIRELSGTVELKNPGTQGFIAAKIGDRLSQDTVISTAFKSSALVEVGSTVITVRPLTRLTLSEISASSDTETLNVDLQAGRVRVDVNPPAGARASVSVASPIAVASVRGTSWETDGKYIYTRHGNIQWSGRSGPPVSVREGFSSSVGEDRRATPPNYVGTESSRSRDRGDNSGDDSAPVVLGDLGSGGSFMPSGASGSDPSSGNSVINLTEGASAPPAQRPPDSAPSSPPVYGPPADGGSSGNDSSGSGSSGVDITVTYPM